MHPFTTKDTGDFFGRERLIAELLEKVRTTFLPDQHGKISRLLTVFGPSGSGKSSVIMAGLLPALQRGELPGSERWIYLDPMAPGPRPLEALARTFWYRFTERSVVSLQEDLNAASLRGLHILVEALLKALTRKLSYILISLKNSSPRRSKKANASSLSTFYLPPSQTHRALYWSSSPYVLISTTAPCAFPNCSV